MHSTVESYWTLVLNLFFLLLMLSWKVFQRKRTSARLFVMALFPYWKTVAMCLLFSMLKISLSFWKSFNFLYYAVHLLECILDNHCPFKKCEGQNCTHITNTICDGHTFFLRLSKMTMVFQLAWHSVGSCTASSWLQI